MQMETVKVLERAIDDIQDVLFDLYELDNREGENQLVAEEEMKVKKILQIILAGRIDQIVII